MKKAFFSLLLAAACSLQAGKAVFTSKSQKHGNIQFDGKEMVLNVHFRNNGEFEGKFREILRVADFAGNGEAPVINEIELKSGSERKHAVTIPAEKRGCFNFIYTLMQNERVVFQKTVPCAKLDPVKAVDPKNSMLGMYVYGVRWYGSNELPVVKNMGLSWIRCNCNWVSCQPKPDVWDWRGSDAVMKLIRDNRMYATLNLMCPPKWAVKKQHQDGGNPVDFEQFAEFAARACARYPEVIYWSLWNEPDNESVWDGGGKEFARLLKTAVPRMKKANPNIKVLPGGVTGHVRLSEPFMRELLKNGGGEFFDVYDFHYNGFEVHKKIAADFNWKKPFWNSELSGGRGIRRHAMPRETITGLAHGLERVLLFIWFIPIRNQDQEAEFGETRVVDNEGRPTFNFRIVYELSRHLNGIAKVEDFSRGDLKTFRLLGKDRKYWVCWKAGYPRGTFAVRTDEPLTAVTVDGATFKLSPANGMVFVPRRNDLSGRRKRDGPAGRSGGIRLAPALEGRPDLRQAPADPGRTPESNGKAFPGKCETRAVRGLDAQGCGTEDHDPSGRKEIPSAFRGP